jgi:mRNA-degrading endonuclease RelE of RelBE toxin-antitoxin system
MPMKTIIDYFETELFKKDFNKLLKKFRSLEDDLEVAKRNAIEGFHVGKDDGSGNFINIDSRCIFLIQGFCSDEVQVCKIKKFACKALKGRGAQSGIRIIYAFDVKSVRVDFIEIYFKADQENEDKGRIKAFLNR